MDRKQKLATAGAISLTATAAVVALGASVGLFGLTDDSPKVGKLSPIDSTQTTTSTLPDDVQTIIIDDTVPSTPGPTSNTSPATSNPAGNSPTTSNTLPDGDDDNSGPGSSSSGHGSDDDDEDDDDDRDDDHDDDDNSGSGGSGRDHPEDD